MEARISAPFAMEIYKKPSEGIIGYTAGLLDGEGSIRLATKKSIIQIVILQSEKNNGRSLMEWLIEQWKMGTIRSTQRITNLGVDSKMWIWQIGARRDALFLLETLLPYLIVKRDKAIRAIELIPNHIDEQQRWASYTEMEDDYIRANYQTMSVKELATNLSRTPDALLKRAVELGVQRSGGLSWRTHNPFPTDWTAAEFDFLRLNYGKMPVKDISTHLGRTIAAIQKRAGDLGLTKKIRRRNP